jgi:hypothetical protein
MMVPIVLGLISSSAERFSGKLTGLLTEAGAKAEADERHKREAAAENFMVDKEGVRISVRCPAINHKNRRRHDY